MELNYKPPGKVAAAFLQDNSFFRGIMGPIGSGKSTVCVMEILQRAQQMPPCLDGIRRSRWAVIRNTMPQLKTTTIKTWHQWIPPTIGKWHADGPTYHRLELGGMDLEVLFLALDSPDDVKKVLSLELTGAWINEAREVPKLIRDGITGRVGRYPAVKLCPTKYWSGVIADTNPPDDDHWWYKEAEENAWAVDAYGNPIDIENCPPEMRFKFFRQGGGLSPEAENLPNLNEHYYARAAIGKDPEWVKVYIHGEYGFVMDGKPVYSHYRDGVHCMDVKPTKEFGLFVGIDFGLTPAAVFGQKNAYGQWLIFDEVWNDDMGAVRFGEALSRHIQQHYAGWEIHGITGDPAGDIRAQTDERTPFQILKQVGIAARPAPTNDPIQRIEAVQSALGRMVEGKPGFIITPKCKKLRKGMNGGYCYKRTAGVNGVLKDKPEKNDYSHLADALQYLMMGAGEGKALISPKRKSKMQTKANLDYDAFNVL